MKEYFDQPKGDTRKIEDIFDNIPKDKSNILFNRQIDEERQELKPDDMYDMSEKLFKEINPMGLLIPDVKKNLEDEIEELENQIKELNAENNASNSELINEYKKTIEAKNSWIKKIDDYLLGLTMDEFGDFESRLN